MGFQHMFFHQVVVQDVILWKNPNNQGEGVYTVDEDRLKIGPVIRQVLLNKLRGLLRNGDLTGYRMLWNQQPFRLRGLPVESAQDLVPGFDGSQPGEDMVSISVALAKYLHQNGLTHPLKRDIVGMSPLLYAVIYGSPLLVEELLQLRADPNDMARQALPDVERYCCSAIKRARAGEREREAR